jgi:uncharacterized membrane protein
VAFFAVALFAVALFAVALFAVALFAVALFAVALFAFAVAFLVATFFAGMIRSPLRVGPPRLTDYILQGRFEQEAVQREARALYARRCGRS